VKADNLFPKEQSPSAETAKECTVSPYPSKKNRDRPANAANEASQSAPPEGIAGRERIARD
jgi:hypothetical protein